MKNNTKSSVTLPPETFALVRDLRGRLGARSNVEVVRRGLMLLREQTDREALRASFRVASQATREALCHELAELDHLAGEGVA